MIVGLARNTKIRRLPVVSVKKATDVLHKNYGIKHVIIFELGVPDGYAWKCKSGEWGTIHFLHKKGKLTGKKGKWMVRVISNSGKRTRL